MVMTAQNKSPQNPGLQHIRAGNAALQQGKSGLALAHYIEATKKSPENHHYKIHLCEFLKNIKFPNYESTMQEVILGLLQTDNLDYQCLWQAWLSLLIKDPDLTDFQNIMHGQNYDTGGLEKSLNNEYLIIGIKKLFCVDIKFERALQTIKNLIDNNKIKSEKFIDAFNAYNQRTENMLSNEEDFILDYKIDDTIPSLSKIKNKTSQDVQNQYEHSPYPRWTSYHLMPTAKSEQQNYDHLIAGCGTGFSTCMTSMLKPHARITAIDLSRASLTYARQKATELNLIDNIDFYQADILDLSNLDKKFSIIECSGVLHHMKDPLEGWRCLIEKLTPDGKMHIGLYSELGRADVVAARQFIKEQKFKTTPTDIKLARQALADLPKNHPAQSIIRRRDFYNLSGCRDLIFHVQEHRFTIEEIENALKELGLTFDGFNLDNASMTQQYRAAYPDDPQMKNLTHWHQFEQNNPDSFRGMYQFWCHLA